MIPTTLPASRGRPRGDRRSQFTSFVSDHGRFTLRDVVARLDCGLNAAEKTVRRALAAHEIVPAGTTRLPDAKRPVAVYAASVGRAIDGTVPLATALRCWAR